jgi:hypothetical protein
VFNQNGNAVENLYLICWRSERNRFVSPPIGRSTDGYKQFITFITIWWGGQDAGRVWIPAGRVDSARTIVPSSMPTESASR